MASQSKTITLSPAFTDVTVASNEQEKQIQFEVGNSTNGVVTLQLYPVDFKQNDQGVIEYLRDQKGSFSYSLASFLHLESNTLVLKPQEKKSVFVSVKNREDLSPGGHYAAIFAQVKDEDEGGHITQVSPVLSGLILLRKTGGERFNLSIYNVDYIDQSIAFNLPTNLRITFQNEGNVHLVPYGEIVISEMTGRVVAKGVINESSLRVFPETRRYIDATIHQTQWMLPISILNLKINGRDSINKTNYKYNQSYLYVHSYVIVFVVIVITGYILWRLKRIK